MYTLQEGQSLLDRIREMGMHADLQNRHATTAACYGIEPSSGAVTRPEKTSRRTVDQKESETGTSSATSLTGCRSGEGMVVVDIQFCDIPLHRGMYDCYVLNC